MVLVSASYLVVWNAYRFGFFLKPTNSFCWICKCKMVSVRSLAVLMLQISHVNYIQFAQHSVCSICLSLVYHSIIRIVVPTWKGFTDTFCCCEIRTKRLTTTICGYSIDVFVAVMTVSLLSMVTDSPGKQFRNC